MADDHATLPVALPSLDHLTNEELAALRTRVVSTMRDVRRKATLVIGRTPSLAKPWSRSLNVDKDTPHEERVAAFTELERELLKVPEAYLNHAYANTLVTLDLALREEVARRTNPKKKPAEPPPKPEPKNEKPEPADFAAIMANLGEGESV